MEKKSEKIDNLRIALDVLGEYFDAKTSSHSITDFLDWIRKRQKEIHEG